MGWATENIAKLQAGHTVSFRPRGDSMRPRIKSGQLCTVEPVADPSSLSVGDIVLCKVRGQEYLHLIKAIQDSRFLIGNNRGRTNGWIGPNSIFGRLAKVEPMKVRIDKAGRIVLPKSLRERLGWRPGMQLQATERPDGLMLSPIPPHSSLVKVGRFLIHAGRLPPGEDVCRAIRRDREWRTRRLVGL